MPSVVALLLAAGESRRMGQNKALLPWRGATLLQYQVAQLIQTGVGEVIVVLGHDAGKLWPLLKDTPGVTAVVNPDYRQGRTTSIKAGLRQVSAGRSGVLVLAVDQPRDAAILRRLVQEFEGHPTGILVPAYQGRNGHPAVFAGNLLPEMQAIDEERQGLREVMQRHRSEVRSIPFDTPEVLLDINTPEQYRDAVAGYGKGDVGRARKA